jgi:hypothetical protein
MDEDREQLQWHEVQAGVDRTFSIWMSDLPLKWAARVWKAWEGTELTTYRSLDERGECVLRAFALGALYREFCARAFKEGLPGEWQDEIGYSVEESKLIDDLHLGILIERNDLVPTLYYEGLWDSPNISAACTDLVATYLPEVHDALLKTLGEDTTFAEMWATVKSSDCFRPVPVQAHEDDEDEHDGYEEDDFVVSFPLDDNSVRSIVNGAVPAHAKLFPTAVTTGATRAPLPRCD